MERKGRQIRPNQENDIEVKKDIMYPPLELANQLNISAISDGNKAKSYLLEMQNGNDDLLRLISTDSSFGTGHYKGEYQEFSDYIYRQWKNMYKWATGYEPDKDVFNKANRDTVKDSLVGLVLCSKWGLYKKVYRFDPELELALATVDEVKIPVKMLDKVPYRSFYLEFAPDGIFAPTFHGCFVEIMRFDDGITLKFVRLNNHLQTMSGTGDFAVDKTEDDPYIIVKREEVDGKHDTDPNGLRTDWEEFCFFALNAIIYLCASNADIRKVKHSPSTLLTSKKIKQKAEALNISECGYVYGETIRLNRKKSEMSDCDNNKEAKPRKAKKSPRPHPVRASWQHYWKGKGNNKERVLIFKDAYFTGSKVNYATISRVKR